MSTFVIKRIEGIGILLMLKNRIFIPALILATVILGLSACRGLNSLTTTPAPKIVATAWTAETTGQLVEEDGCLRIRDIKQNIDYALVWPPDNKVSIDGSKIHILTGVLREKQTEVEIHIGDWVNLSGGETNQISEELSRTLSPSCQAPYWIVGFEITPIEKPY